MPREEREELHLTLSMMFPDINVQVSFSAHTAAGRHQPRTLKVVPAPKAEDTQNGPRGSPGEMTVELTIPGHTMDKQVHRKITPVGSISSSKVIKPMSRTEESSGTN